MKRYGLVSLPVILLIIAQAVSAQDAALRAQASKGLRQATDFFRSKVSTEGGYLWRYSDNLTRREGERKATASQVWVQPPGTPSVGLAFLHAFEGTGDAHYLEAARETGLALVNGQLHSGGWDYSIEFDPKERKKFGYRVDPGSEKGKAVTTLDDNTTQEALRFLMRLDKTLQFKDGKIHDAVGFGLTSLLKAQYPNGAWAQRFDRFPDADKYPVMKASYPASWSRTFPNVDYKGFYTFNDNSLFDVVEVMLEAAATYNEPRYKEAAEKAGAFILLAQMPEPQPAWAQQYDLDMHPAWARKFEPPAITGGESFGVMRCLLSLYRATGDKKYLEPIPRALAYFEKSQLPDGRLARFYELKTNKPLYFTKEYQLTYKDDDLPTHYGFKVGNRVEQVRKEFAQAKPAGTSKKLGKGKPQLSPALIADTKAVLAALDTQGRWVEEGKLRYQGANDPATRVIETRTFIRNVNTLSNYLAATK